MVHQLNENAELARSTIGESEIFFQAILKLLSENMALPKEAIVDRMFLFASGDESILPLKIQNFELLVEESLTQIQRMELARREGTAFVATERGRELSRLFTATPVGFDDVPKAPPIETNPVPESAKEVILTSIRHLITNDEPNAHTGTSDNYLRADLNETANFERADSPMAAQSEARVRHADIAERPRNSERSPNCAPGRTGSNHPEVAASIDNETLADSISSAFASDRTQIALPLATGSGALDISEIQSRIEGLNATGVISTEQSAELIGTASDAALDDMPSIELVESICRTMNVEQAESIDIFITKNDTNSASSDTKGDGTANQARISPNDFLTMRLSAPEGGFIITAHSPEAQWPSTRQDLRCDYAASWRFTVMPTRRGKNVLQLSYGQLRAEGLAIGNSLQHKMIEVGVRANLGKAALRATSWAMTLLVGVALGAYFDEIRKFVSFVVS